MSNAKAASAMFLPCGISCGHRASSRRRCCISGRRRAFNLCIIAQEATYKCHLTMFLIVSVTRGVRSWASSFHCQAQEGRRVYQQNLDLTNKQWSAKMKLKA